MAGLLITLQPEAGPSTTMAGDWSQSHSQFMHPDNAQSQEAPLNYGTDEDTSAKPDSASEPYLASYSGHSCHSHHT